MKKSVPVEKSTFITFFCHGCFIFSVTFTFGQSIDLIPKQLFTIPNNYSVTYTDKPPIIDGDLSDKVWQQAKWTAKFVDIEGDVKPLPPLSTQVKMLWNDSVLFIAAKLQEPQVWATLKKHDQVVFHDNDFEVFIDPNNQASQYFEIEVNPFNTLFDLYLAKPYRSNSGALVSWDTPGTRTAVKVQGTLNKSNDIDSSWTVEMAIPFKAMAGKVPNEGSIWRINFSRVEWDTQIIDGKYVKKTGSDGKNLPEHNWVWSPQGVINMHYPERWGYLQFTKKQDVQPFELPHAEKQKQYLWFIYYTQKDYFRKNGRYASALADVGIAMPAVLIDAQENVLQMESTAFQFTAIITAGKDNEVWSINEDGLIKTLRK